MRMFKGDSGVRGAFTLIELLVVIAIIGVLVSVMLPALSQAKYAAMKTKDAANIKSWALGFLSYAADNRGLVPASVHVPTTGEAPGMAYMTEIYGAGSGCNLMPAIDGYNLRQLTQHPFRPIGVGVLGSPGNPYPPASYWTSLNGYWYFPGYDLTPWPSVATTIGSPVKIDKGRPSNVIIQDFLLYLPTYMTPDYPYSVVLPSSLTGNSDPAIGLFREKIPPGVFSGLYDGSVKFFGTTEITYTAYYPNFYVGHTQPQ